MKIADAVEQMSKQHLKWVVESFTHDLPPMSEEDMRQQIAQTAEDLASPERVRSKLELFDQPHSVRTLIHFVLESLINAVDCAADEGDLTDRVRAREERLIEDAADPKALQYADEQSVHVFQTVLEVALDDDRISRDEFALVEALRNKLRISRKQQWLIESRLDSFPKMSGKLHTHRDVVDAVRILEKRGVLFYCNRMVDGSTLVVLPEELQRGVKKALGIELSDSNRTALWENIPSRLLHDILRAEGLPIYGKKAVVIERLEQAEIKPSDALSSLTSDDLYDLCDGLPGVNVSGTKAEKIERILDYFDSLVTHPVDEDASRAETAFEYLVQLSWRDYGNLRANKVIRKDNEIEHLYEAATSHVFGEVFGLDLLPMNGSKHPDGCSTFPDDSLFMWDCKSQEKPYEFPHSHADQFKRYMREFGTFLEDPRTRRVNVFLIVVPDVADEMEIGLRCRKAKATSGTDTDVAVVAAEDLKWLAEKWSEAGSSSPFDLNVFNETGVLTRRKLEQLGSLFLGI